MQACIACHSREAAMEAACVSTDAEPVLEDWLMKRNCSMSPRQFVLFYASLAGFSLAIAAMLMWQGAWLVMPFTGVELLAVGVAFAIYARHAVDYERIRLFPHRLVIERMNAEQLTQIEFNPRWVRVEPGATPRDPIRLVSRGQTVVIGQHLAQYRRAQFADELRAALRRCG
ncbi:hypothetical protein WL67_31045 [Burkholderia ubonensis]|uniref:DUF2244 domain-containing protein n=2 Tax=Burkholderia ubonensis TaxID=101571 RepID=A0ABD6Q798_9BURK|nr:hypothetical protein WJ45_21355 [Burkholderia ubonensis]KVQ37433.1 hypothetical protein WK04_22885 [Burkholderia ubonensis]KWD63274.1 hypothetical protein WL66_30305 [Burkholderia ubonensis]KWD65515.1 hypothetical protein WL67_31045 [Burkholderia ubonensis]OJA49068.1 hypothetical protein BGV66_08235 [Burkholderia ubonensis]